MGLTPQRRRSAQAGIQWPALMGWLIQAQTGRQRQWGIVQKLFWSLFSQTGADRLSLGGALAANIHGRGLRLRPVIGDGRRRCSRAKHRDLFRLAIGDYGLFGIIASVRLRLTPKRPVERHVEIRSVDFRAAAAGLMAFQFAIDAFTAPPIEFLRTGILSCYGRPAVRRGHDPG